MESFIVTDKAEDMGLILRPEVELIVIKRPSVEGLSEAIENFDVNALNKEKLSKRGSQYIDGNRLFLSEKDAETRRSLAPIWKERGSLRRAFHKAFGTDIYMTDLFIQPAIREGSRDYTFHRDYATGFTTQKEWRENEVVFMTVAHKGFGTEVIPGSDAGRATPLVADNRSSFYHPKTLQHLFAAETNDVLIMKAGRSGTVHRAPHQGEGLRWWTFFSAGPISTIRKNLRP